MRLYVLTVQFVGEDRRDNPFGGIYRSLEEAEKAALKEIDMLRDPDQASLYPTVDSLDWERTEQNDPETDTYGPWAYVYNDDYDVHFHISGQEVDLS